MVKHDAQGGFEIIQWCVGGVELARRLLGGFLILMHPSNEWVISSHGAFSFGEILKRLV